MNNRTELVLDALLKQEASGDLATAKSRDHVAMSRRPDVRGCVKNGLQTLNVGVASW